MSDKPLSDSNTRLVDAVRQVKIASAERGDVVVDMKEADRARLELLAQNLQPVFDDVPLDDERFDFALSSGLQPRLWIDATAHVMMGRDRRTYRFVRDTRMGRLVLAESTSIDPVAEAVTGYIAERLHERELAFAGDEMVTYRQGISQRPAVQPEPIDFDAAESDEHQADAPADTLPAANLDAPAAEDDTGADQTTPRRDRRSVTGASATAWILIGLLMAGAAAVLVFRDVLVAL